VTDVNREENAMRRASPRDVGAMIEYGSAVTKRKLDGR
jgi:hypothetical protein